MCCRVEFYAVLAKLKLDPPPDTTKQMPNPFRDGQPKLLSGNFK